MFITAWGTFGTGDSQFRTPVGVALDPVGNVYTVDTNNGRVQKFTGSGAYLTQWEGTGLLQRPSGVAVDASGNVYVADTGNSRIRKYTSDGVLLLEWGEG